MLYNTSQNYTNMKGGKHGTQTLENLVVVLLLLLMSIEVFVPTSAHLLLFLDTQFVQMYLNDHFEQYIPITFKYGTI